ncbi:hypothetical protein VZT92_017224 [Zoarces viviparus]|uniref:Uncharacterized protein n=1 Tax=Zoarces viviparus TaxID=48416 RepID=A0AAW1EU61_ZOAVI
MTLGGRTFPPGRALIGCSVTEQLGAHWKPGIQLVEPGRGAPTFSTAGGAAELRKPKKRRRCQDSSSSLRSLEDGTASSAARHEGLHPNCAPTLQDAALQQRSSVDSDRN